MHHTHTGTIEEKRGHLELAVRLYEASTRIRPTAPAYVAWAMLVDRQSTHRESVPVSTSAAVAHVSSSDARMHTPTHTTAAAAVNDARTHAPNQSSSSSNSLSVSTAGHVHDGNADSNSSSSSSSLAEDMHAVGVVSDVSMSESSVQTKDNRDEARRLFELGIRADPKHGPLYNAYGSMEARLGESNHSTAALRYACLYVLVYACMHSDYT
jgi:hypothetical protein